MDRGEVLFEARVNVGYRANEMKGICAKLDRNRAGIDLCCTERLKLSVLVSIHL